MQKKLQSGLSPKIIPLSYIKHSLAFERKLAQPLRKLALQYPLKWNMGIPYRSVITLLGMQPTEIHT